MCIGVQPVNDVIVSGGHQGDSAIHRHLSILLQTPLPARPSIVFPLLIEVLLIFFVKNIKIREETWVYLWLIHGCLAEANIIL